MEAAEEVVSEESPQSYFHRRAWDRQWCSYERIPDRYVLSSLYAAVPLHTFMHFYKIVTIFLTNFSSFVY